MRFTRRKGIAVLLPSDPRFKAAFDIGAVYDDIYATRVNVWEDQGRTDAFIEYFAEIVSGLKPKRLLEIGCGEGILLARLPTLKKAAIDLSSNALARAQAITSADFAVALAERLPFPDCSFDAVCSVGVMEHFLDENQACAEIRRVLRSGGHYVALIHVSQTRRQDLIQKGREYIFPVARPIAFVRWLASKLRRPVHQPIQRHFSLASGKDCLERSA